MCCCNILDNTDNWKHFSDYHGSLDLNYIGQVHESLGRKFNGYSPSELLKIEAAFLKACGYQLPLHHKNFKPENPTNKDILFDGLTKVITFLCELDGFSNIMDYTKLFEFENDNPKYRLKGILI